MSVLPALSKGFPTLLGGIIHNPWQLRIEVYNYYNKPLRRQIEEGVLFNIATREELLNSKSEITSGGEIPRLVIMVGDKEISSNCSKRLPVQPDTLDYSYW